MNMHSGINSILTKSKNFYKNLNLQEQNCALTILVLPCSIGWMFLFFNKIGWSCIDQIL